MTLKEVIKSEIIRIKLEEAFEQGVREGIKRVRVVKKMLTKGDSIDAIAEVLEISREKVLEIKEKLENTTKNKE